MHERGMTLIEALVAITILAVAIVAPMALTVQSLGAAYYARDQIAAFHLAQEALESVRAIRDSNILKIAYAINDPACSPVTLLCYIPIDTDFTIDTRNNSISTCSGECPRLQTDGNLYGYESGWVDTVFRRTVRASYVPGSNSEEILLTVDVEWRTGLNQERSFSISSNLSSWLEEGSADGSVEAGYSQSTYYSQGSYYSEASYYAEASYSVPGSQYFTVDGSFTVPAYTTLTVKCWGGGGGGGSNGTSNNPGQAGGASTFGSLSAGGGQGGGAGGSANPGSGGAGGTASGGTTNTTGNAGGARSGSTAGIGATAPSGGGSGGAAPANLAAGNAGNAPGGGGSGGDNGTYPAGGGGSGAYVERVYGAGQLIVGASIPVVIGTGGAGGLGTRAGGAGGAGECRVDWL